MWPMMTASPLYPGKYRVSFEGWEYFAETTVDLRDGIPIFWNGFEWVKATYSGYIFKRI